MEETFYICPYCFTEVSILVETSLASQEFIEDCERCCNPINFKLECLDRKVIDINAFTIDQ